MRMRRKIWFTASLVVAAAAALSPVARGAVADTSAVEDDPNAPVAGNGHVEIATGGYFYIIPKDFAGGIFGTQTDIYNRITFNAKLDADGSVSGWYNFEQAADGQTFKFAGPVTCMRIYDTPVLPLTPEVPALIQNRVKWGGRIDLSNDPTLPPGTFIWFQSMDNGEGAQGWSDSSSLPAFGDEATNIRFCNSNRVPNPVLAPHRVGGGNIQVR